MKKLFPAALLILFLPILAQAKSTETFKIVDDIFDVESESSLWSVYTDQPRSDFNVQYVFTGDILCPAGAKNASDCRKRYKKVSSDIGWSGSTFTLCRQWEVPCSTCQAKSVCAKAETVEIGFREDGAAVWRKTDNEVKANAR